MKAAPRALQTGDVPARRLSGSKITLDPNESVFHVLVVPNLLSLKTPLKPTCNYAMMKNKKKLSDVLKFHFIFR